MIKKQKNILFGNCYTMIKHKAFICGIKGYSLRKEEIKFLKKYKPWGVILFSRNINTIKQTQTLTSSIKKIFKNSNYPILIDEEGGKVSRLRKFIDNSIFSNHYFGKLYLNDRNKFYLYFDVYVKQVSYLLRTLGININNVPVLDVRRGKSDIIIGNRSYSSDIKIVSKIGNICIDKFHKNRIATVIKHIPGHGLANVDSHKKLPVINENKAYLIKNDFSTFKNKKSLLAMTGHLKFKKIDSINNSTQSEKIVKIIRNEIKFKNLLLTDDLSMKALNGTMKDKVKKSFTAGCNLVLHCNGNLKEMKIVGENSPNINKFVVKKTSQLIKIIS